MRYCSFYISVVLVTAEAAILDGQFVKKKEKKNKFETTPFAEHSD